MYKVLYCVQGTVKCARYCKVYKVLYSEQGTVQCTRYCTVYKVLYSVQGTVQSTRYCTVNKVLNCLQCPVQCTVPSTVYIPKTYLLATLFSSCKNSNGKRTTSLLPSTRRPPFTGFKQRHLRFNLV